MLCDRDDVGAADFGDGNVTRGGCAEVDMVGADAGSDAEFEVGGFGDEVGG